MQRKTHLTFHSTLPDPHKEYEDQKAGAVIPGGIEHAKLLSAGLCSTFRVLCEPWDEEGYGWEFQCEVNGMRMSLLIQEDWDAGGEEKGNWLLILIPVVFLRAIFRKKVSAAVDALENAIAELVKCDERLSNFHRYTAKEYELRCDELIGKGVSK